MAFKPDLIRTIIFDLDDTLFDTNGQLVEAAALEAFQAMINAGLNGTLNDCLTKRREILSKDSRKDVFGQIAEHFGVKKEKTAQELAELGFEIFHSRDIREKISLFQEVPQMLEELRELYDLFLVTMGSVTTQKKKVELLKLSPHFTEVFYINISIEKSKTRAFKEILTYSPTLKAENFLCVGNRIDSEIKDAKTLGMQTVLFVHGEHINLVPQNPEEEPDERIEKISELMDLL